MTGLGYRVYPKLLATRCKLSCRRCRNSGNTVGIKIQSRNIVAQNIMDYSIKRVRVPRIMLLDPRPKDKRVKLDALSQAVDHMNSKSNAIAAMIYFFAKRK
jgi:hypothetical protein